MRCSQEYFRCCVLRAARNAPWIVAVLWMIAVCFAPHKIFFQVPQESELRNIQLQLLAHIKDRSGDVEVIDYEGFMKVSLSPDFPIYQFLERAKFASCRGVRRVG